MSHAPAPDATRSPAHGGLAGWIDDRAALVAAGVLLVTVLALLGPALVGRGAFGGADYLLNFDPWRATAPTDAGITRAPMSDIVDARLPRLDEWGEGLRDADLRLWNPYPAGGTGQHVDAFAPTEAPYALLPVERATAWATLLGVVAAALGTIAFLRAVGVSRLSAVAGAAVYTFSGFQIAWTLWPQSHVGAVIPLLFWAVERQARSPGLRAVAAIALTTGWVLAEGFPAVAVIAGGTAGAYGVVRIVLEHPGAAARLRTLGGAAAGAALGIAIAGVAIVPLGALLDRAELPRDSLAGVNSEPVTAVTLVSPDALGPPDGPYGGPANAIENASFVGMGALLLAGVALSVPRASGRRGVRTTVTVVAVVVGALIFVDGPHVDLAAKLPVLDFNPLTRLRSVLGFAIAVVAALGLDALQRAAPWSRLRVLAVAAVGAALSLLVVRELDRFADPLGVISVSEALVRPALVGAVVLAAIVVASRVPRARGVALVIIVVVLVLDGAGFASGWWRTTPDDRFYPETPAHAVLDTTLGPDRFAGSGGSLITGTGTYYGHRELTGNVGHTAAWADLLRAVDPDVFVTTTYSRLGSSAAVVSSPILDRLAVRYVSYPIGTVPGVTTPPPPSSSAVEVAAGERITAPWPGDHTGAVVFDLDADLVPSDPFAVLVVEVVDGEGTVVADGRRRVFGGIPAGELAVPVTTPTAAATAVELRFESSDGTLRLGVETDGVPQVGAVTLPDDTRVVLADGLTLVERQGWLPRIRWATRAEVATDPVERVAALGAGVDDDTVVLSAPGGPAGPSPAVVDVVADGAERIVVDVDATDPGYLVIADALEETWHARVDGEAADLVTADHAVVAVAVGPGRHRVELVHDRGPFGIGLALSLAGLVIAAAMLFAGSDRRRLVRVSLLVGGALVLVVIAVIAWRSLDPPPDELQPLPLLVLGTIVLVTYVVVSVEFQLAGRMLDVEIDAPTALVTTTIATVANLLPLPGAAITRVVVLRRGGATAPAAVRVLVLIGGLWLGVSMVAAGIGIAPNRLGPAAALAVAGVVAITIAVTLLRRDGADHGVIAALVATETAMIALGAVRLWLALRSLGIDGSVAEVVSVGVAAPLSAAVGFVPAGLGVREAIAVVLGALSGLGGAEAGVAATLDRTVGLLVLAPVAVAAFALRRRGVALVDAVEPEVAAL